jgi:uncharacterized protein YoxC
MKFYLVVFCVFLVQALAEESSSEESLENDLEVYENEEAQVTLYSQTKDLMDKSKVYQDLADVLQDDINSQLFLIRNAVAEVLQENMNGTVKQTDTNSASVLVLYSKMEEKMSGLVKDECYEDLIEIAKRFVSLAGFQISNILEEHDRNVSTALGDSEEIIRKFDRISTDVQRSVMRSYIKQNLFRAPEKISQIFISNYDTSKADWDKIRPTIDQIIIQLRNNFNGLLDNLSTKFAKMQTVLENSYETFNFQAVNVCIQFARTARVARSAMVPAPRSHFRFFNPEDILPKFE